MEALRERVLELLAVGKISPEAAFEINQALLDLERLLEKLEEELEKYRSFRLLAQRVLAP